MPSRLSTKNRTDKEDEQAAERIKPAPKQKPPRYDLRRDIIKDKDPDLDKKDKDLSMNYKDIGGSTANPLDEAICLVSMRMRSISPDVRDVDMVRAALTKQGAVESDLTNPHFYPVLAKATLNHIDRRYKHARYLRVVPSADGRRFEMGAPVLPRNPIDPLRPEHTKALTIKPSMVTDEDHNILIAAAQKLIDPTLMNWHKDIAYRNALDMAISTVEDGKYDHMLDAENYLACLNKLSTANLDLTADTYVPDDLNQGKVKTYEVTGEPFDMFDYYGEPVEEEIDVHKDEEWKKHFDHPEPYAYDKDEPYMKNFKNPKV